MEIYNPSSCPQKHVMMINIQIETDSISIV